MKEVDKGYIALFRQFMEWEWYDDANTMRLFIHCLLLANYKNKKWRGKTIRRGQFITSQPKLANSLKLSIMQIRNSLMKLKSTGEITVSTTADYSIITVKNYNLYQDNNSLANSLTSENEQSNNSLTTTTNKDNKDNNSSSSHEDEAPKKNNEDLPKITEEEEELLKNRASKNKIKYFRPWLRKILANGDYVEILEKEKKKIKKREDKKNAIEEDFKKVDNKYKASMFVGIYGDFTDENHPDLVKQVMEKWDIPSFTEAVRYQHECK